MRCFVPGAAGDGNPESSNGQDKEEPDEDAEVAYVRFLLGDSPVYRQAYEEENQQVGKMFEEFRNSSAGSIEVSCNRVCMSSLQLSPFS